MSSSASVSSLCEPTNSDEVYMQQSMLFADSLKDLKNLRKQLHIAAEYFELSYTNGTQELDAVDSLKDYAIKALVNTVDHLGSVATKVNDLLDDQVDKVSGTELHLSCVEQRLQTFQKFIDCEGHSLQSLTVDTPKYHKRYLLPVGETMHGGFRTKSKYQGNTPDDIEGWHEYTNAIQVRIREAPSQLQTIVGISDSPTAAPILAQQPKRVFFSENLPNRERRVASPYHYPPPHSTSLPKSNPATPKTSPPVTPRLSRPMTPNLALRRQQYLSELQKAESLLVHSIDKGTTQQQGKSKGLLKGFLNRHKSKKDDYLDTHLDNTN